MGIFNKIKSLFIVEEEDANTHNHKEKQEPKAKEIPVTAKVQAGSSGSSGASGDTGVSNAEMEKFSDILFKAIEKANKEGFDYLEFRQSIKNLKKQKIAEDEAKLFEAAYALANTMNVTKQQLIESAHYYLEVLKKEEANFNESLANNAKVKLAEKRKKLEELKRKFYEDKKQLEILKKRLEENHKTIDNMIEELDKAGKKVESLKNGFRAALTNISDKIKEDIEKIKKYIKS